MRTLAITGIETVSMISRMMRGAAMRATPPSLRMSEGTRSSAITAHAPADSAILACSALVTSMITPPFSISAKPTFTRHRLSFIMSMIFLSCLNQEFRFDLALLRALRLLLRWPGLDDHEAPASPREQLAGLIANLAHVMQIAPGVPHFVSFNQQVRSRRHRFQIFDGKLRRHRANAAKPADLAHGFVEHGGNNTAVNESRATLILGAQAERATNALRGVVLFEGELHAAVIRAAAAETCVRRIGLE